MFETRKNHLAKYLTLTFTQIVSPSASQARHTFNFLPHLHSVSIEAEGGQWGRRWQMSNAEVEAFFCASSHTKFGYIDLSCGQ